MKSNLSPFPVGIYQGAQKCLGRLERASLRCKGRRLPEADARTASASECMMVVGWLRKAEGAGLQRPEEYTTACQEKFDFRRTEQENHKKNKRLT